MSIHQIKKILMILILLGGGVPTAQAALSGNYLVMGYLQTYETGINVDQLPYNDLTHIIEAFAVPDDTTGDISFSGSRISLISTAHANGVRVCLSVGGQSSSDTDWSADVQPAVVGTFVSNIMNLVEEGDNAGNSYDGVDIDWEFPNSATDETNFTNFMKTLYTQLHSMTSSMDEKPLDLTFFISAGGQSCYVNWATIGQYCDYGILSGYAYGVDTYNGPLSDTGTYGSCLLGPSFPPQDADIAHSAAQLFNKGFSPSQLIIGCPMYGVTGPNGQGNFEDASVFSSGTSIGFNSPQDEASYNYSGSTVIMDTDQSFCDKMSWAFNSANFPSSQTLPGIALWDIGFAYPPTGGNSEVTAIWSAIGGTAGCFVPPPTPTLTPTNTPTPTSTPCMVGGVPCTSTATSTPTDTPTITPTSQEVSVPIVYPNPTSGQNVYLRLPLTGISDVKVEVFSLSFRKVWEQDYSQVAPTTPLNVSLNDKTGVPLANGLYYVVAITGQSVYKTKLLILR